MQIIWITTQFPSSEKDTKGRFIYRTVSELSKSKKIVLINLHSVLPPVIPILKDLKNATKIYKVWHQKYPRKPVPPPNLTGKVIYAKYIRLPRGFFHFMEGWFGYFSVKKYVKDLMQEKSIVHATWLFPEGDTANIIFKKYKIPFVVTLMGSDVHFIETGSKKWKKAKEIVQNAEFITSVSQQLYLDLENKGITIPENKRQLTHTIYEFEKFKILDKQEIRNQLNLNISDKIIFYAGNLREIKNVDILITSFSKMFSSNLENKDKIKLIIAGKGEEEGKLNALSEQLKVNKKVNFVGGLNSEEIIKYYNASDVFCLPSKNEGLPNVIVEALLCGTPVVASSVGEIPFIIENDKNGFLVKPNDMEILTKKLEKALSKTWNREELRKSVVYLNPENVLSEYKLLYSKMEKSL
jgi:glycosyltransferase involved in cell wall biosynthesis